MKISKIFLLFALCFFIAGPYYLRGIGIAKDAGKSIDLPRPSASGVTLDYAIKNRRTVRSFDEKKKVTLQELSNILYAMQGLTEGSKRTVPSAHGGYPLELYIVANNITGLDDGLYKMDIPKFKLILNKKGDLRDELSAASMGQPGPRKAQIKIIVTCVWKRLSDFKDLGKTFAIFEAGEASQNAYLMATALKLHMIPVGGINPEMIAKVIGVNYSEESPIIVNCIGR